MVIQVADSDAEILACFPVMRELRTHLSDADAFLRRVRAQQQAGYRLACLSEEGEALGVAGFRLSENLAWGRFLYVDDLVTLPQARSRGVGAALLAWLADLAREEGAAQLHLDSGTQRLDAHRFYEREGLRVSSLHFNREV